MSDASSKPALAWNWIESLMLGVLALVGVDIGLSLLMGLGIGWLGESSSLVKAIRSDSVAVNFSFYAVSRLIGFGLILWFIRRRGVSLKDFGFRGFSGWKSFKAVLIAAVSLLVVSGVAFYALEQSFPSLNLDEEQQIVFTNANNSAEIILAFMALVVIAPIVEEAIFRGFMLPAFAKRWGFVAAALLTSMAFGAIHGQINVGIITFIMGLLLAWLYKRLGSLWPAIMFHSLKNLIAFVLIFGSN